MEKRALGVILTILGIVGLVLAGYNFAVRASSTFNVKLVAVYSILGLLFFFAGISLVSSTKDVIKRNEHVG